MVQQTNLDFGKLLRNSKYRYQEIACTETIVFVFCDSVP
jgi:hypothetical protein